MDRSERCDPDRSGNRNWAVLNVNGERYAVRGAAGICARISRTERSTRMVTWSARGTNPRYEPTSGRMIVGPQAGYEKVPGLDTAFIQLTKLWPLRRAEVIERDGKVYVRS